MPSVPIEMPSLTPMVLNRMPTSPAAVTPFLDLGGQVVQVHVAGVALVPHAGDADLRLVACPLRSGRCRRAWPARRPATWAG